jgi:hypothetical protein
MLPEQDRKPGGQPDVVAIRFEGLPGLSQLLVFAKGSGDLETQFLPTVEQ